MNTQWKLDLLTRRLARDYEASPDKGMSFGPRRVHVANANEWDTSKGVHLFAFGPYGCTYVLAFGTLEDALEEAAEKLLEVEPGCFVEPDYTDAAEDLGVEDSEENTEMIREQAEADLTYTESGYLASWEWTVVGSNLTAEQIRAWAANKG